MKKLSILSALLLAVTGLGLAGCQDSRQQETEEPGMGLEEPNREPVVPGEEERTGFEEEQDTQILEEEPNPGSVEDELRQGEQNIDREVDEQQNRLNE